jgi:hypothetical protein
MKLDCGFWEVQYVCKHKNNPTNVELVFVKGKQLEGEKELVDFIEKEISE